MKPCKTFCPKRREKHTLGWLASIIITLNWENWCLSVTISSVYNCFVLDETENQNLIL